ncbi:MAG TPA: adenylate/guanylate cyclase domain-containing protein [Hyphomicrobiaceae bacterium]|nr:adenylate/guanylate cyclase domain-containing protein [Hyphomicrobiaceae bacterium]
MDDLRGKTSERRQLTVLFCDIVDSTGLSERCDPEDLSEILLEFQAISTGCIKDAGGNVINYIGDGIRSEFGYPLSSENEALAAVRAGLVLLRAVAELSERATATIKEPLRVRIGVHTGLAVIGKAAPGHVHRATEIVGDTPNIAFRLLEAGAPNSLVISNETRRLLRGKFQLQSLGLRTLKGLSRKMEAFQVLGELLEGEVANGDGRRNASPLVGRSAEINELLQAWERVKAGRGQSVEITGEPGIGKSRLALELIDKIARSDDAILVLQASAQHQNVPLHPIIKRFEQRVGIRTDEPPEVNAARLGEFLGTLPSCDEETPVLMGQLLALPMPRPVTATLPDAQELRRKTRDCVVHLLTSPANGDAGLILVEDFHWLDPSTAEVVERIAARIGNAPILLLITSRSSALANGSASIRRVPLQRLADAECRNLADCVVADKQLPSGLIEQIISRSDGVPLFLEELAAAALETGQVDPGTGASVGDGGHGVPSALYDSLMLRLERLGDAKAIAQLASVIGRSFSHQLLAAIASEHGIAFQPALARLLESGLLRLEPDDDAKAYTFKHALVRDVAYYSLLKRQRRELHARVADAIELHLPEISNREPAYLAQHLSEAGRTSRAVRMLLKAAAQSAERSANLETSAQLGAALEEIKRLPAGLERDNLELEAHIALIGPTIALKGFAAVAVAEVSHRAIELCHLLDDDPRIFPALYARWSYLRAAGNVSEAGELARDYLTIAELKGTRTDRMVGHRLFGTSLHDDGEPARARKHLERASKLYDATSDHATALIYGTDMQVTTLSNLCIVDWVLGQPREALEHGRAALELAGQLRHAHTLGYAFSYVCMLHTLERDVETVETLARQALTGATQRELSLWISVAQTFLGWAEVESGCLEQGIDTLEKQRAFLERAQLFYWLPTYLCWLTEAHIRAANPQQAKICLAQAREFSRRGGNSWYEAEGLRLEGRLAAADAQNAETSAERCFEQALAFAHQRGQRGFALRTARDLAALLAGKGEPARAHAVLQAELRFFEAEPEGGDRTDAKALLCSLRNAPQGR